MENVGLFMKEETTNRLDLLLKNISTREDAIEFAENHSAGMRFFYEYLNDYIALKGLVISQVIMDSGISRNYVYNILNGNKKNPGRDKVIALCIAAGMDLTEVNRGLKIAGHNSLYPKNPRDIQIASLINRGEKSVLKINLELHELGLTEIEI